MDKAQLLEAMKQANILDTSGSRNELWLKAFELYNAGRSQKLKMSCGSCFNEVRKWLKS